MSVFNITLQNKAKIGILAGVIAVLPLALFGLTDDDAVDVNLYIQGCNNNNICEAGLGENINSCPNDCTADGAIDAVVEDDENRPGNHRKVSSSFVVPTISVIAGKEDVSFAWYQERPILATVEVGSTNLFERFASSEIAYQDGHLFFFNRLQPSTTYFYRITGFDTEGVAYVIIGSFTTLSTSSNVDSSLDFQRILNPLVRIDDDGTTTITWSNPPLDDYQNTIVVRTLNQPATQPSDGVVVYDGDGQRVRDDGIVDGGDYFYTWFGYYEDGRTTDPIFIPVTYNKEIELTIDTEVIFGDNDFSIFDFTFDQQGKELVWESKEMLAMPFIPIQVLYKKVALFDLLQEFNIESIIFNDQKRLLERQFSTFRFTPGIGYIGQILNNHENATILFKISKIDENKEKSLVIGRILVGAYEAFGDENSTLLVCYAHPQNFVQYLIWLFICVHPWPLILLTGMLPVLMSFIRQTFFKT